MKIIASMTTIPSRISHIRPVIEAVLSQTVPVEHLELNIPYKFIRTNDDYEVPGWIQNLPKVQLHRTHDYGAITKVAPTLIRYRHDMESYIWSVDDDFAYPANQLEILMAEHDPSKRRILTRYGGELLADGSFRNWWGRAKVTFLEGFGGVLYPPMCVSENFDKFIDIVSQNDDCRNSDDIVLSMYFNRMEIPVYLNNVPSDDVPYELSGALAHAQLDSLTREGYREKYRRVYQFINSLDIWEPAVKLELGCGINPSPGYLHHDLRRHSPHVDVVHDLNDLPWPWEDESFGEILALDVFEHLHLMPEAWLRECYRILCPSGVLRLRVPIFGSPWHLIDPTHVRGFHELNFDYFIIGRELWHKYGHYYFDFAFKGGDIEVEGYNIVATLKK